MWFMIGYSTGVISGVILMAIVIAGKGNNDDNQI